VTHGVAASHPLAGVLDQGIVDVFAHVERLRDHFQFRQAVDVTLESLYVHQTVRIVVDVLAWQQCLFGEGGGRAVAQLGHDLEHALTILRLVDHGDAVHIVGQEFHQNIAMLLDEILFGAEKQKLRGPHAVFLLEKLAEAAILLCLPPERREE